MIDALTRWHRASCTALTFALASLVLTACGSSPSTRFHTLMPPATPATAAPARALSWDLADVVVPAQVDQPQLVVRTTDDSLTVMEHERWIAPLADEIRGSVVDRLSQTIGASVAPQAGGKAWRVRVDVQRFDSAPGRYARTVAEWSLFAGDAPTPALRCRGTYEQAVAAGFPALAAGHRQALTKLADSIAAALVGLDSGSGAGCPSS